ncbi:hypothetical protein [Roseibium litorale]|uniref:SH3 domain-containing protein n=1 Tax=Roseibium litorale TaxID=2803841 RepID=A0ABR9CNL9_9HYPH|nr:hypothetical protein [Roseibium litorale]MBD8892441.1 hypothetical protein [Roseibium litorale]
MLGFLFASCILHLCQYKWGAKLFFGFVAFMFLSTFLRLFILISLLTHTSIARSEVSFRSNRTNDGLSFIIVSGQFESNDDLSIFHHLVQTQHPKAVSFNSEGGSIIKAMELGRAIRQYGLSTLQLRMLQCASACSLAFMGGVERIAEPGSIGVHKSSFSPDVSISTSAAVSLVQELTAEILDYMSEMGVNPKLMQLALKTEAYDIRYLSGQEMSEFNLTTGARQTSKTNKPSVLTPQPQPETPFPSTLERTVAQFPIARTGRIRHPKGSVMLKSSPDTKSPDLAIQFNGDPVEILSTSDRWYKARSGSSIGYLHHTWVRVDQFEATSGLQRLIQIKSFDKIDEALNFSKNFNLRSSVFVVTNGWYAVTLEDSFDRETAIEVTKKLKSVGSIPKDSFITFGNTYIKRICCN